MGCFLCTLGSTIIVIHAPMEKEIANMLELERMIVNPVFVLYVVLCIVASLILIYHYLPRLEGTQMRKRL